MGREHIVPLSRQALVALEGLSRTAVDGPQAHKDDDRPMVANAVADESRKSGVEPTAHGFRATARTILDGITG